MLPCGTCVGCIMQRARSTAVRCMHEAQMHEFNSFLTLTYDDEHLPHDHSLRKDHFQKFINALRSEMRRKDWGTVRYLMCGEYGDNNYRPHYHALLFGMDFPDKKAWRKQRGHTLYRSALLERLWPYGFSEIGSVTFQSAAYVARYVLKKHRGDQPTVYVDPDTGEIHKLLPEYTCRSLKPGLGESWFLTYKSDVYPHDFCVVKATKVRTPRYYDVLLERHFSKAELELVKKARIERAEVYQEDLTPKRLRVQEKIQQAKIKLLKRTV